MRPVNLHSRLAGMLRAVTTHESAAPARTVGSPVGAHNAQFLYAGEIRFGPPFYLVKLDGLLLSRRIFGKRYFGAACLWSTDSRYLVLSEWRSLSEARGPDTQVVVIDIFDRRECVLDRMRAGFAEPVRFEGKNLVYTKTFYDRQRKAHLETCNVDLTARRAWRKMWLHRP